MMELILFNVNTNQVVYRKRVTKDQAEAEQRAVKKSIGSRTYYQVLLKAA